MRTEGQNPDVEIEAREWSGRLGRRDYRCTLLHKSGSVGAGAGNRPSDPADGQDRSRVCDTWAKRLGKDAYQVERVLMPESSRVTGGEAYRRIAAPTRSAYNRRATLVPDSRARMPMIPPATRKRRLFFSYGWQDNLSPYGQKTRTQANTMKKAYGMWHE
jgi:hypothetical protein